MSDNNLPRELYRDLVVGDIVKCPKFRPVRVTGGHRINISDLDLQPNLVNGWIVTEVGKSSYNRGYVDRYTVRMLYGRGGNLSVSEDDLSLVFVCCPGFQGHVPWREIMLVGQARITTQGEIDSTLPVVVL